MRRQIMALVVGLTTLVILAFAIPVALLIRSSVVQNAERAAVLQANNVALTIRTNSNQAAIDSYLKALAQNKDRRTSVRTPDGTLLGTAPPGAAEPGNGPPAQSAPNEAENNRPPPGGEGGEQAQLRQIPGGQVAELALRLPDGMYFVQVYVSNAALHSGEVGRLMLVVGGSLALLVVSVLGAELLTRRIVRPLVQTAETAHLLTAGDVTARAPTNGPREVAEVGASLNQLADRIDELVAEERETVANLSHRMRTPLTALRLESESLRDPAERERIATQASALERTLTAVIHAARRPQREGRLPSADATAVVRDRVAFWSALTDEQERACTLTLPDGPLIVRSVGRRSGRGGRRADRKCRGAHPRRHAVCRVAALGVPELVDLVGPDRLGRRGPDWLSCPGRRGIVGSTGGPVVRAWLGRRTGPVQRSLEPRGCGQCAEPVGWRSRVQPAVVQSVGPDRADRKRRRSRVARWSGDPRTQRPRVKWPGVVDRATVRAGQWRLDGYR